jgi:peptidoglycan/LPS O-acetylase OafA/YrhL
MKRMKQFLLDSGTAAWISAFMMCSFGLYGAGEFLPGKALVLLIIGLVYGVFVRALITFFPVHRWGMALAGFFVGPLPMAMVLVLQRRQWTNDDDRGLIWALLSVLGMVVGLMEWSKEASQSQGESHGENGVDSAP